MLAYKMICGYMYLYKYTVYFMEMCKSLAKYTKVTEKQDVWDKNLHFACSTIKGLLSKVFCFSRIFVLNIYHIYSNYLATLYICMYVCIHI